MSARLVKVAEESEFLIDQYAAMRNCLGSITREGCYSFFFSLLSDNYEDAAKHYSRDCITSISEKLKGALSKLTEGKIPKIIEKDTSCQYLLTLIGENTPGVVDSFDVRVKLLIKVFKLALNKLYDFVMNFIPSKGKEVSQLGIKELVEYLDTQNYSEDFQKALMSIYVKNRVSDVLAFSLEVIRAASLAHLPTFSRLVAVSSAMFPSFIMTLSMLLDTISIVRANGTRLKTFCGLSRPATSASGNIAKEQLEDKIKNVIMDALAELQVLIDRVKSPIISIARFSNQLADIVAEFISLPEAVSLKLTKALAGGPAIHAIADIAKEDVLAYFHHEFVRYLSTIIERSAMALESNLGMHHPCSVKLQGQSTLKGKLSSFVYCLEKNTGPKRCWDFQRLEEIIRGINDTLSGIIHTMRQQGKSVEKKAYVLVRVNHAYMDDAVLWKNIQNGGYLKKMLTANLQFFAELGDPSDLLGVLVPAISAIIPLLKQMNFDTEADSLSSYLDSFVSVMNNGAICFEGYSQLLSFIGDLREIVDAYQDVLQVIKKESKRLEQLSKRYVKLFGDFSLRTFPDFAELKKVLEKLVDKGDTKHEASTSQPSWDDICTTIADVEGDLYVFPSTREEYATKTYYGDLFVLLPKSLSNKLGLAFPIPLWSVVETDAPGPDRLKDLADILNGIVIIASHVGDFAISDADFGQMFSVDDGMYRSFFYKAIKLAEDDIIFETSELLDNQELSPSHAEQIIKKLASLIAAKSVSEVMDIVASATLSTLASFITGKFFDAIQDNNTFARLISSLTEDYKYPTIEKYRMVAEAIMGAIDTGRVKEFVEAVVDKLRGAEDSVANRNAALELMKSEIISHRDKFTEVLTKFMSLADKSIGEIFSAVLKEGDIEALEQHFRLPLIPRLGIYLLIKFTPTLRNYYWFSLPASLKFVFDEGLTVEIDPCSAVNRERIECRGEEFTVSKSDLADYTDVDVLWKLLSASELNVRMFVNKIIDYASRLLKDVLSTSLAEDLLFPKTLNAGLRASSSYWNQYNLDVSALVRVHERLSSLHERLEEISPPPEAKEEERQQIEALKKLIDSVKEEVSFGSVLSQIEDIPIGFFACIDEGDFVSYLKDRGVSDLERKLFLNQFSNINKELPLPDACSYYRNIAVLGYPLAELSPIMLLSLIQLSRHLFGINMRAVETFSKTEPVHRTGNPGIVSEYGIPSTTTGGITDAMLYVTLGDAVNTTHIFQEKVRSLSMRLHYAAARAIMVCFDHEKFSGADGFKQMAEELYHEYKELLKYVNVMAGRGRVLEDRVRTILSLSGHILDEIYQKLRNPLTAEDKIQLSSLLEKLENYAYIITIALRRTGSFASELEARGHRVMIQLRLLKQGLGVGEVPDSMWLSELKGVAESMQNIIEETLALLKQLKAGLEMLAAQYADDNEALSAVENEKQFVEEHIDRVERFADEVRSWVNEPTVICFRLATEKQSNPAALTLFEREMFGQGSVSAALDYLFEFRRSDLARMLRSPDLMAGVSFEGVWVLSQPFKVILNRSAFVTKLRHLASAIARLSIYDQSVIGNYLREIGRG